MSYPYYTPVFRLKQWIFRLYGGFFSKICYFIHHIRRAALWLGWGWNGSFAGGSRRPLRPPRPLRRDWLPGLRLAGGVGGLTHVTQFFTRCRLFWRRAGFDLRHDLPPGDVSPDPSRRRATLAVVLRGMPGVCLGFGIANAVYSLAVICCFARYAGVRLGFGTA